MALNSCAKFFLTAVALLLLPAQYYVPDLYTGFEEITPVPEPPSHPAAAWFDLALSHLPPQDLFFTLLFIFLAMFVYVSEWIQRKLLEKRLMKLNQYLGASVERLRALDAQQEQLEATLKMVQNATCEYSLLLYLLLRRHRCLAAHNQPPSNCFFDKDFAEDLPFIRSPAIDAQAV